MADKYKVSQSKVKTWRRCHRAYHFKYVEKLKAKKKSRALTFGSLVHQMIETHAEGDDPMLILDKLEQQDVKLFAAERAEQLELLDEVRRIMTDYFAYWDEDENPLRYERIKGKSAEHSFEIEVLPDVIWNGKIDARGKRNGLRWMIEHKTFSRRPTDDDRWRNLQSSTYFRAMDIIGMKPVDGTCWDYIWSKPPVVPGLLKNGSMSQKTIDTLPSAVQAALEIYQMKQEDYAGFLKAVKEKNSPKWFFRIYTRVDETARDYIYDEFIDTVIDMVNGHGKKKDMNIERHCSWCEFEPLCRALLQGLDYEYVKERLYEEATNSHHPEEPDHVLTHDEVLTRQQD